MDKKFLEGCLDSNLSTRDIEKICDKKRSTISHWIHKYNLQDTSNYRKAPNYTLNKIDTKEKAYLLGFMLGDGHIANDLTTEISVAIKDKEVVEFLSKIVNGNVHYSYKFDKASKIFPKARLIKKITDITKFTGGAIKKDRHYPRVREDLERFLLLGLFDAEGCITWGWRKDKGRLWHKISITSQLKILQGAQQYLIKLGINSIVRPKGNEDCFVIEFANRADVSRFLNHIYPNDEFVILKRKYLKANALRLELEENGESVDQRQYRAEPAEQEGVETSGDIAIYLNDRNSIQANI